MLTLRTQLQPVHTSQRIEDVLSLSPPHVLHSLSGEVLYGIPTVGTTYALLPLWSVIELVARIPQCLSGFGLRGGKCREFKRRGKCTYHSCSVYC